MNTKLFEILAQSNPWLVNRNAFPDKALFRVPKTFIPRNSIDIRNWPLRRKAPIVIGARQVGKSSLIWKWIFENQKPPLFINSEELLIQEWCKSPTLALKDIRALVTDDMPVFIDEVQHLEEAGLFIKGLIDGGIANPLFATGSSAFHLKSKTRESLAGRADRIHLHPLSLGEICYEICDIPQIIAENKIRKIAMHHMITGGYPEAWLLENSSNVLKNLLTSFVIQDASDLFKIKDISAFKKMLELLPFQIGSLVNFDEWASLCSVSNKTIRNYLGILENSHIIFIMKPFAGGKRAEITSRPKVYFCDNGIYCASLSQFDDFNTRIDKGALFENWVASELIKSISVLDPTESIRFWRSKSGAEVDFVVHRQGKITGVEAKASHLKKAKLSRSARSFIQAYEPDEFYVINLSYTEKLKIGKTVIRWTGPDVLYYPQKNERKI